MSSKWYQKRFSLRLLAIAVVVVGIGGIIGYYAYFTFSGEVVILRADNEEYKERVAEPGGKKVENLDSPVLSLIDSIIDNSSNREVLLPPDSEPEPPPISVDDEKGVLTAIDDAIALILGDNQAPKKATTFALPEDDATYFLVQFAAFKKEKSAADTAALLNKQHASRLGERVIGYMHSGNFWRVVTDFMTKKAEAVALCDKFVSVGQDCFVRTISGVKQ